jgi:hypothetical protein
MVGLHISVSGAIFTQGLISQPLTDYISLTPGLKIDGRSPLDNGVHRIAQLFFAIMTGIETLDADYATLMNGLSSGSLSAHQEFIGPHFRTFHDLI